MFRVIVPIQARLRKRWIATKMPRKNPAQSWMSLISATGNTMVLSPTKRTRSVHLNRPVINVTAKVRPIPRSLHHLNTWMLTMRHAPSCILPLSVQILGGSFTKQYTCTKESI